MFGCLIKKVYVYNLITKENACDVQDLQIQIGHDATYVLSIAK